MTLASLSPGDDVRFSGSDWLTVSGTDGRRVVLADGRLSLFETDETGPSRYAVRHDKNAIPRSVGQLEVRYKSGITTTV